MTAVIGYAEMSMFRIAPNDPVRDNLSQIKSAGEKAGILTRQLLAFSRKQVLQPVVLNLNSVVKDIERMLGRIISEDIELITAVEDDLWNIDADPGQIEQVLMNLVLNSRDAMPDGGTIVVETSNVELDGNYARFHLDANPGQYAVLAISDTGVGMDEETRAHIFEPFYTTKPHTKGTGLGLSTVYGIVKQSGGFIWVYSELGLGTTFKIYLPRVAGEVAEISQMSAEPVVLRGSETILLVEDEEIVRNLAREILDSHGYNVLEARDGIEAMIRSREYRGEINILLTDIIMPDMGGPELHAILSNQRQQMRSIFMSGYTGDLITRQGLLDKKVPFIQKPFTPDGLLRKVRETLAG